MSDRYGIWTRVRLWLVFRRRVAVHVRSGHRRPEAREMAGVETYGGDVIAVDGVGDDFRVDEAKRLQSVKDRRLPLVSRVRLRLLYRRRLRHWIRERENPLSAVTLASFDVYGGDVRMGWPDGISRPTHVGLQEAEDIWFRGVDRGGDADH